MKAYAKEQGIPSSKSNNNYLKGFVDTLPRIHGISPSFDTFLTISSVLVHCSILFTSLSISYYIYKAVYKNGKKNPVIYGAYWATVLFLIDVFFVTVAYYEVDAIKDQVVIAFLTAEGIISLVMACTFTCFFAFTKEDLVFPIPIICSDTHLRICKDKCRIGYVIFTVIVQAIAMWFTVAGLHVFVSNITVNRVEVFLTSPLETFIEFVFYLLLAICFFVVLNLPFYIGCTPCENVTECCCNHVISRCTCTPCEIVTECCTYVIVSCGIVPEYCNYVLLTSLNTAYGSHNERHIIWKMLEKCVNVLNIGVLLVLIIIAGFSNRYLALTLSQSQDSDARLLITVLPTIAITAVVAFKWPYIKKFVRKLHPQEL